MKINCDSIKQYISNCNTFQYLKNKELTIHFFEIYNEPTKKITQMSNKDNVAITYIQLTVFTLLFVTGVTVYPVG